MKKKPEISIIIPSFGREENLKTVLDSLNRQSFKNFEVVIVQPKVSQQTKAFIAKRRTPFPIKLVEESGVGLVSAVNDGVRHAVGKIVIRTDDDVLFSPNWLKAIKETFSLSPKIGGVSGPTIIPTDRLKNRGLLLFFRKFTNPPNLFWRIAGKIYLFFILDNQPLAVGKIFKSGAFSLGSNFKTCLQLKKPIEVNYLEACNYAVYKKLVERVGSFDEQYLGIGDWNEPDLCFKVRNLGYKLMFNPKARVDHLVSQGGVFSARSKTYIRSKNFIRFYFKHIKPDSLEKIIKFSVNLLFINGFFLVGFFKTGNFGHLTGLWGTARGLVQNILGLER